MQAVLASREVRFTQLGTKISVSSPGGGGRDEGVVLPNAANTDRFCATSLFDMRGGGRSGSSVAAATESGINKWREGARYVK